MSAHTHYENLKVARNAPPELIRAAYRVLAQKYHPDLNPSPDAARVMKLLNEAYAVLSDPKLRAAHDAWIDDQLLKEALDDDVAPTQQEAADVRGGRPEHAPSHAPSPVTPPTQPVTRRANYLGAAAVLGVVLFLGFQLTAGRRSFHQPPAVAYPQPVAAPATERGWSETERSAGFLGLTPAEKDSVREAYFERVVAPKVARGEVDAARAQFYRDSGHTQARAKAFDYEGARRAGYADAENATNLAGRAPTQDTAPTWSPNGKPWPIRAAYLDGFPRRASPGLSTLTVDNTSGGANVYVKLCRATADRCDGLRHVFIPIGASFTMSNIAPGLYDIRYRSLDNGELAKSEPMELVQIEEARGTRYSNVRLTLYRVAGGNTSFEALPEDKF